MGKKIQNTSRNRTPITSKYLFNFLYPIPLLKERDYSKFSYLRTKANIHTGTSTTSQSTAGVDGLLAIVPLAQ